MKQHELKAMHDALLEGKPEDVAHDASSCAFCSPSTDKASIECPEGVNKLTELNLLYSQEQADSLIAAAITKVEKDFDSKLADALALVNIELETSKAEVASVQAARDADQLVLAAAQAQIASFESEKAAFEEEIARASRKDERLIKVAEVAKFSDEYVAANTDRWVAMDEDSFASLLTAYVEMAAQVKPVEKTEATKVPEDTAMATERVDATKTSAKSALFNTLKGGAK